jgi:hypothetical protein
LLLPVYRVAVAFITLLWRSRLPRSILPRKLIILGLFRFINSCAGSVGNFRCTPSDTFWAAQDTSMSRECWHLGQESIPSDTFWSDILWLSGRISSKPGAPAFPERK